MFSSLCVLISCLSNVAPATFVLNVEEDVWDVAREDINGDGFGDLFILNCDGKSDPLRKQVSVFVATPEGGYTSEPQLVLPLAPTIGAVFFAETDGTAPKEFVAVDAAGATVYQVSADTATEMDKPRFMSLLPNGSKEPVFIEEGAVDLDGDGIDEWLIPMPGGYELRQGNQSIAQVSCDVVSEIRRVESTYISHRLPAYQAFQLPGISQKGIAFLSDEFADFAAGPGWQERNRFKIPQNLEEKWEATSRMKDINQDNFPDLLVTQTRGTINIESKTNVYIASAPYTYPSQPTASFSSKGAIASPALIDIDGDKNLDLVIVNVEFGVKNIMNYFVRSKIAVDAEVHIYNGTDFGNGAAYSTTLTLEAPEGRERVAYAVDDFDGDGRKDVAFGRGSNLLVLQRGQPDKFVEDGEWLQLQIPSFGTARPYELNGKNGQDLVLFHPGGPNSKRVDVVVF